MSDEIKDEVIAYCFRCKAKRKMKNPRLERTGFRKTATMIRGNCEVCDCKMTKFTKSK